MILKISTNKTRYDKGQVFPFLIAIIVVIVIIAMITVNLGQIGIFKTDVSNAADSAALAGASILSGYLLQCGLKSDMMAGQMIVEWLAIIVDIIAGVLLIIAGIVSVNPDTVKQGIKKLVSAITTYVATTINMLVTYLQTLEDGKMAWSNAKKTALQYAFQNVGVDEPRPTFYQFLKGVYGISREQAEQLTRDNPAQIATYNRVYYYGEDPSLNDANDPYEITRRNIQTYTENGFARFMRGPGGRGGYWDEKAWGEIKPGHISPPTVTSGYGWGQTVDAKGNVININSYDDGGDYTDYDNYVEVRVIGNVMYPLRLYNGYDVIVDLIDDFIETIEEIINVEFRDKIANILNIPINAAEWTCKVGCNTAEGACKLACPPIPKKLREWCRGNCAKVARWCREKCTNVADKAREQTEKIVETIAAAFLTFVSIMISPIITLWSFSPGGLKMKDIISQTRDNPITVTVKRHKKESDLGLWKFRYGTAQAQAKSHAYPEDEEKISIEPLFWQDFFDATLLGLLGDAIQAAREGKSLREIKEDEQYGWFETNRHLFETELTEAR